MPGDYQLAAYYFPNYHVDRRKEKVRGYLQTVRSVFGGQEPLSLNQGGGG